MLIEYFPHYFIYSHIYIIQHKVHKVQYFSEKFFDHFEYFMCKFPEHQYSGARNPGEYRTQREMHNQKAYPLAEDDKASDLSLVERQSEQ